jgi:Methyl-accepting chemotaxis protein (MCP) signaling domain./HAMP domain.
MVKLNIFVLFALLAISGASLILLLFAFQERTVAFQDQLELNRMSYEVSQSMMYTSEQARTYTQFAEPEYLQRYEKEKKDNKILDKMNDRLKELDASPKLLKIIEEIRGNITNLEKLESEAFQDVENSDLSSARKLVYGDQYKLYQSMLDNKLNQFDKALSSWVKNRADQAEKRMILFVLITVVSAALLTLFTLFILFTLTRKIRPLQQLTAAAEKISGGDLQTEIPIPKTRDEVALLAGTFHRMNENLKNVIKGLNQTSHQVASSSEELLASSEQSATAAEQISKAIEKVSATAEAQTNQIESNLKMFHEVESVVNQTAEQMDQIHEMIERTNEFALEGEKSVENNAQQMESIRQSVEETAKKIESLLSRSEEIDQITLAISEIADQTNLLALNAAIEAARAGEHGRGFAVVAEEVRKLAEQSQESAKKIAGIISQILGETAESVELMEKVTQDVQTGMTVSGDTSQKFRRIMAELERVTPIVKDVAERAKTIVEQLQTATGVEYQLVQVAQENAATAEEVSSSSEEQLATMQEIASSAENLAKLAEEMQNMVKRFKL